MSLLHFLHDFWMKVFHTMYFINWPNLIAWLPLLLAILANVCIIIIYGPVSDVISFEINHIFFMKLLFYTTRKSGQKWAIMINIIFKQLLSIRNYLRPLSGPLRWLAWLKWNCFFMNWFYYNLIIIIK